VKLELGPRSRSRGGFAAPNPPVFVIVSDIRDSEIQYRIRVLYSYSYLRGSYEIEADLTYCAIIAARDPRRRRPPIACSAFRSCSIYIPQHYDVFFYISDLVII
jgi:hypothetical protein